MKKGILFINGISDDRKLRVSQIDKKGNLKWTGKGGTNIKNYIGQEKFNCINVILDTRSDQKLPRKMVNGIFNEISDPDTHKITLQKAEQFYEKISSKVPFFNIPYLVMQTTRNQIYQLLQGIKKLHVPKTIKIQPKSSEEIHAIIQKENFQYPVILRQAGDHGGVSTIKIHNETEQFYAFALDGRDYYLTQFVEYEEDGLYKKYRLIVIDGKVYLRHVKISEEWMVHHKNQIKNPEQQQKMNAKRFIDNKQVIQEVVAKVYEILKLDYFGIDCYIDKEGNLLIFEINPSMSVFLQAKGDIFSKNVDKIRYAVIEMINSRI